MKAVLLAGGLGSRFAEETDVRPKPMIEIGDKPIIWHVRLATIAATQSLGRLGVLALCGKNQPEAA